jgi:glycosyltransferase involved in cell wall biosynthesis
MSLRQPWGETFPPHGYGESQACRGFLIRHIENQLDLKKYVIFTGFLSFSEYIQLMYSVSGVLCFTKRDYTLLSGGEEALFLGKPLLTFRFPFLEHFFNRGTVFVEQNLTSIRKGILFMIKNQKKLENEMIQLQTIKLKRWKKDLLGSRRKASSQP